MPKRKKQKRREATSKKRGSALPVSGPESVEPPLVGFVSLGCVKNLVDSEKMLGQIAESGAVISGDESAADVIVVNTCGFLDSARQEALDVIRELAERKRRGELRRLVVAGCLVQRDGRKLLEEVPEIDALVGVNNRDDVVRAVWRHERGKALNLYLGDYHPQPWSDQGRLRLTPRHYAYVRISEGCDQQCTFCTIPAIRGPLHCKSPDRIVAECRELIADGTRELILIGQDTTGYGRDIGYEPGLAGLLRTLNEDCDGARWIRLMYAYPSAFTDAMIEALAECERFVKYIDLPLQHINDRLLKVMGRRVTRKQTEALLEKLRGRIPGVTIRTTFIVGFPGETEAEFGELLEFVRDFRFDALGTFKYSLEPDTPAGKMDGQLEQTAKEERYERLMLGQQEIAFAAARRRVGERFDVVVDGLGEERRAVARHAGQAPDVDAVCYLDSVTVTPGEFVPARCVATDGYDLLISGKLPAWNPSTPPSTILRS
ncbi:MAG: 30S ribosomal protein S12 methylthiotransferase RimO [Phycisphaerae bacterium]|nr:30S ribosomal protein S12 methylthiotransferase RimO [Phycisphaerae bacterium]